MSAFPPSVECAQARTGGILNLGVANVPRAGCSVKMQDFACWSCAGGWRRTCVRPTLLVLVPAPEVVDEHLLYRLIVGHQNMADGVAADYVADLFGEVFGVIACALERLSHEDDLQAGLAGDVFGILDVSKKDKVAEAVHFGVGAYEVDGFSNLAGGEGIADVGEHFFEDGGHVGEVAGVLGIDAAGGRLRAVCEA